MNLQALNYHCGTCTNWYTKAQCPKTTYGKESVNGYIKVHFWCECGKEVFDAHETGTVTPYDEMKLVMLRQQRKAYQNLADGISRQMTEIDGVSR